MRLFLVRHGAVEVDKPGSFYGGTEVPLSQIGCQEAENAGLALADEPVSTVYSSPLNRAVYGAKAVASHDKVLKVHLDGDLKEIGRGRWVGLTPAELETLHPGDFNNHVSDPWGWREHGGESLEDLRVRVLGARDRILKAHEANATIVLVSHMFPTRAILADALELGLKDWSGLDIPTGSISLVEYQGAQASVKFMGKHQLP